MMIFCPRPNPSHQQQEECESEVNAHHPTCTSIHSPSPTCLGQVPSRLLHMDNHTEPVRKVHQDAASS